MRFAEEYTAIYRTLLILWRDGFFLEPKSLTQVHQEITRPSTTSADIDYDREELVHALFALEMKGVLQSKREAAKGNPVFLQLKSPEDRRRT